MKLDPEQGQAEQQRRLRMVDIGVAVWTSAFAAALLAGVVALVVWVSR